MHKLLEIKSMITAITELNLMSNFTCSVKLDFNTYVIVLLIMYASDGCVINQSDIGSRYSSPLAETPHSFFTLL